MEIETLTKSIEKPEILFLNFVSEISGVNDVLREIIKKYGITKGLNAGWVRGQFNIAVFLDDLDLKDV